MKNEMIAEIEARLAPAGGYVDLDALSVDLPGQDGRCQAISIESGQCWLINCDDSEDAEPVDLEELQETDLRALLDAVRWCDANDGLEIPEISWWTRLVCLWKSCDRYFVEPLTKTIALRCRRCKRVS